MHASSYSQDSSRRPPPMPSRLLGYGCPWELTYSRWRVGDRPPWFLQTSKQTPIPLPVPVIHTGDPGNETFWGLLVSRPQVARPRCMHVSSRIESSRIVHLPFAWSPTGPSRLLYILYSRGLAQGAQMVLMSSCSACIALDRDPTGSIGRRFCKTYLLMQTAVSSTTLPCGHATGKYNQTPQDIVYPRAGP